MKKILLFIGISMVLFSCTKNRNTKCYTCVVSKFVQGSKTHLITKDTVIYCAKNEDEYNDFVKSKKHDYREMDTTNRSDIYCALK
jgi:hypothetical protein